jgi:hypothetical protein
MYVRNHLQKALHQISPTYSETHTHTTFVLKFCYQSVYCFIRYFLVRIHIAECFTSSGKRFQ